MNRLYLGHQHGLLFVINGCTEHGLPSASSKIKTFAKQVIFLVSAENTLYTFSIVSMYSYSILCRQYSNKKAPESYLSCDEFLGCFRPSHCLCVIIMHKRVLVYNLDLGFL